MRTVLLLLFAFLIPPVPLEIVIARSEETARLLESKRRALLIKSVPEVPKAWLEAEREAWARDVAEIKPFVEALRDRLRGETVLASDLREFLGRPDAADRVYRRFLRPRVSRNPVARAAGAVLAERDDGSLHIPPNLRSSAQKLLARCREKDGELASVRARFLSRYGSTGVREMRETGRALARRLAPGQELSDDPVWEEWRNRLVGKSVLVLAAMAKERPRPGLVKVLWEKSRLGHCLVAGPKKTVTINRHTYFELDRLLGELNAAPGPLDDRPILAEMAERRIQGVAVKVNAPLTGYGDRVAVIAREITAEHAAVTLPVHDLEYDRAGVDLFRSQSFYNPRTGAGHWWYTVEFEDHGIARLFGTFGWTAKKTGSVEEFLARIDKRLPHLRGLAKTHDRLIILINTMPPWLSSSGDPGSFEGERRQNREAHPPKDMEVWRKMIRGMVTRLKTIRGVEWYYEFWNEPDLEYWQAGLEPFLELYGETAKTIRAADPDAKVGGCAPNQWDGKLRRAKDRDPVNLELIRHVTKHKLPLDFVSWHVFGRPIEAIAEAKDRYSKELRKCGVKDLPEFLVTEWSVPYRGTAYAPLHMAERLVGFREAGVDGQMVACWEEFHAKPDPKHFPPWGMLTQQGHRKPEYFVHRFFDRIARGSEGVAVVKRDGDWRFVVSKKPDHVFDLIVWRRSVEPRFRSALAALYLGGFTEDHGRRFTSYDRLERAILEGRPVPEGLSKAFATAKKALLSHPVQTPRLVLKVEGCSSVEVLFAESVRDGHRVRKPVVLTNRVTLPLVPYEVLRLTLRARPRED